MRTASSSITRLRPSDVAFILSASVNLGDLASGVYNSANLPQGNNAACFATRTLLTVVSSVLKGIFSEARAAINVVTAQPAPQIASLTCLSIAGL